MTKDIFLKSQWVGENAEEKMIFMSTVITELSHYYIAGLSYKKALMMLVSDLSHACMEGTISCENVVPLINNTSQYVPVKDDLVLFIIPETSSGYRIG